MPRDELDEWLEESADHGPLFEAARARVDAVVVDEAAVRAAALRVRDRMNRPRRAWPWGWVTLGGLAAAALAAWVASQSAPPEPTRPGHQPAAAQGSKAQQTVASRRHPHEPQTIPSGHAATQQALVEAQLAANDLDQALVTVLDLADALGADLSRATADELVATARLLRKVAVLAHGRAQLDGDPELLERAGITYAVYLADFAEPEHETNVRYAYGELLYRAQRYDEAWEQYTTVAADPEHDKARFCGESAVFAAEEMLKVSEQTELWRERFVDSADAYVDTWPDDPKSVDMQYKAAYALYQAEDADAVDRFEAVAMQAPDRREGGFAANLALDARVTAGDFAGAAAFAAAFLAEAPESMRAEIAQIGGNAAFKAAEGAIAEGADATETWAEYRKAWPDGPAPP